MGKSTVLLACTTVALGLSSIYLVHALHAERDRADALQARLTESRAPSEVPVPPSAMPASPAPISQPEPARPKIAAAPVIKKRVAGGSELSRQLANPAYRAAELAYSRLEMERQYPDLAAALNLQPEEADRLLDLLARQALSQREDESQVNGGGRLPDEAAFRALQQRNEERRRAVEAERSALLGEARLDELNQYLNSLGARAQVRELRTMLAESSFPLRSDQVAPLVASLAAEQQRHTAERQKLYNSSRNPTNATPEEVIRYMGQHLDLIEQSLQRRRRAASLYLDSEQQKRYDAMLAQERRRAQIDYDLFVSVNRGTPRVH